MIRRRIFAAAAGLAALSLTPQPLAAQDEGSEEAVNLAATGAPGQRDGMAEAMAMFGKMFPVEPLTAEEQARLPQAQRIIGLMIPEGTLPEMMGDMFDKMLGPILAGVDAPTNGTITRATGINAATLDLAPEQAAELAALFDPVYAERHEREKALFPAMMRDMMTVMEPPMRKAMSELYAIHFSQAELDGIEAFFQTDIGTAYARKSFTLSSDPRIIGATMESMPLMMGAFADMERRMVEASADLPAPRTFGDLSPAEQAKVAALTGYEVEDVAAMAGGGEEDASE